MTTIVREELAVVPLEERIDRMHKRDRLGAIAFVVALWFTILFVLIAIWPAMRSVRCTGCRWWSRT